MSGSTTEAEEISEKAASVPQKRGNRPDAGRDTPEPQNAQEAVSARFEYVVKKGDKMWDLAKKYLGAGGRYKEIMKINGLDSSKLKAGDHIIIPCRPPKAIAQTKKGAGRKKAAAPAAAYIVQRGDTIWAIARDQLGDYKRFEEIKRINGLVTSAVYPGQTLKMPKK